MRLKYGNKDLERSLNIFQRKMLRQVRQAVKETAEYIVAQAILLAPVDTGELKNSIDIHYLKNGYTAVITVGSDYAIYVEFGTGVYSTKGTGRKGGWSFYSPRLKRWVFTRGIKPQPFWFPAIDAGEKIFRAKIKNLG